MVSATKPLIQADDTLLDNIVRRVRRRLLWVVVLIYVINIVDRGASSYAALTMNEDIGLTAATYGLGASLFYFGIIISEIPSNLLMQRFGARIWLARIAVSWGFVAILLTLAVGPKSYGALRFLLGLAEGGALPGILLYINRWFPQEYRGRTVGLFLISLPAAYMVGGPIAGALLSLDGMLGLAGWQWLFLLEGVPAVLIGVLAYFMLVDHPHQARWLSAAEADHLVAAISDRDARPHKTAAGNFRAVIFDFKVLALGCAYACISVAGAVQAVWVPPIVREFSANASAVGWALVLPYGIATLLLVGWGRFADRTAGNGAPSRRIFVAILPLCACTAGWVVLAAAWSLASALTGVTLVVAGLYCAMAAFWTVPPLFMDGRAAAAGIAWITTLGSAAAVLAPGLLGVAKQNAGGFTAALDTVGVVCLIGAIILSLLALFSRHPHKR